MPLTKVKYEFIKRQQKAADARLAQLDALIAEHQNKIDLLTAEKAKVKEEKTLFTADLNTSVREYEQDRGINGGN